MPSSGPSFTAARAQSLPDVVRTQLEAAIEKKSLLPGDRLPSERELAEQFDVSRIVVREALRGLEATNTIEIRPNRGAFVRRPPSHGAREQWVAWLSEHDAEITEILRIRKAIETLAAGEAARRPRQRDLRQLTRYCDLFETELGEAEPDITRLVELDIAFHRHIGSMAGGALLPHIVDELVGVLRDPPATFSAPGRGAITARDHREIVAALASRDQARAADALAAHLDHVIEVVASITRKRRARQRAR